MALNPSKQGTSQGKAVSDMYSKQSEKLKDVNDTLNMDGSNFDLEKLGGFGEKIPHLKFPNDITSAHKAMKSMQLFILKDVKYQEIINAASEGVDAYKNSKATSEMEKINEGAGTVSSRLKSLMGNDLTDPQNFSSDAFHCIITLPIPNNLTEDDSQDYEGDSWNSELLKPVTGLYNTLTGAADEVAQTAAQFANGNRRRSRQISQMPVLNPFTWKKFKGSQLKVFRFTTFFVPRSKDEANMIMRIVYTLKKYSYGSRKITPVTGDLANSGFGAAANKAADFFVQAPPKILLRFANPMLQKLLNPGVCVLDSIGTTYNEGNTVGMTADGIPRFIEVNIALAEYNVRFQEDFMG